MQMQLNAMILYETQNQMDGKHHKHHPLYTGSFQNVKYLQEVSSDWNWL